MASRSTPAVWLAAAIAGAAGCGSSSSLNDECQNACQRVVSCFTATSTYGYGYQFNFGYAAYGFGYGVYAYGAPAQQQCVSDCASVQQGARDRIAQCVIGAPDCTTLLQCH